MLLVSFAFDVDASTQTFLQSCLPAAPFSHMSTSAKTFSETQTVGYLEVSPGIASWTPHPATGHHHRTLLPPARGLAFRALLNHSTKDLRRTSP